MTEQDIKQAVKEVLAESAPEMARRERIARDKAAFEQFAREQRAPREPRESAVDSSRAPIHQEDTVLPIQTFVFNDPVPSFSNSPPGSAPVATVRSRICLEDGTVAVVNVVVQ